MSKSRVYERTDHIQLRLTVCCAIKRLLGIATDILDGASNVSGASEPLDIQNWVLVGAPTPSKSGVSGGQFEQYRTLILAHPRTSARTRRNINVRSQRRERESFEVGSRLLVKLVLLNTEVKDTNFRVN